MHENINYNELFDCIFDSIFIVNDQNQIIFANKKSLEIFKYSLDDIIGKNITYIFFSKNISIDEMLEKQAVTNIAFSTNNSFSTNNAEYFFATIKVSKLNNNKIVCIAKYDSDSVYKRLIDSSLDLVFSYMPDGTIKFVNNRVEHMLGYKPEDVLEKNLLSYVHPDDVPMVVSNLERVVLRKEEFPSECRLRKKNNDYVHVEVFGKIEINPQNEIIIAHGIARDISERRRAQEAIESSGDGVWDWDIKTNIVFYSNKWKTLLGFEENDIKNHFNELVSRIHPEDKARVLKCIDMHFSGELEKYQSEHRLLCKDGSYKWFLDRGNVISRDTNGNPTRFIATHTDITARKSAEEQKEKMQQQILHTSRLASIGTLAAGVAHEINNPLSVAKGYLDIVKDYLQDKKMLDVFLTNTFNKQDHALERIKSIVTGLRTFSRSNSDTVQHTSLHKAITDTISLIEPLFKKDSIEIQLKLKATLNIVYANPGQLQQIIMNLMTNSKDAILQNPCGLKRISISTFNDENNIILEIEDTGVGIREEKKDKIFDPFFTTKEPGKGTGLGLSIIHSLVSSMKGSICLKKSIINEGTVFRLAIPVSEETAEKNVKQFCIEIKKINAKALVIDDEEEIRNIMRRHLHSMGVSVYLAENAEKAIELVKNNEHQFDYIITDLKMPGMNGFSLISELNNMTINSKIIILTGESGYDCTDSEKTILRTYPIITKPFKKEDIYNKLTKRT